MKITMDTTFQEIRDAFANINTDDIEHDEFAQQIDNIRNNIKNDGNIDKQYFDFLIAIILGGFMSSSENRLYIKKYNSKFFSGAPDGNSWRAAFLGAMGLSSKNKKKISDVAKKIFDKEKNELKKEFANFCKELPSNCTLTQLTQACSTGLFDQNSYPILYKYCDNPTSQNSTPLRIKINNIIPYFISQPLTAVPAQAPIQQPQVKPYDPNEVTQYIGHCIKNSRKKNIIFTGAPGTGKTYSVEKYVNEQNSEQLDSICSYSSRYFKFVQFHGSYDYTDFVEGLRPIERGDQMVFVRMDGTFKALCREAAEAEKENGKKASTYYFVIDEINRAELSKVFGELMYCFEKRGSEHKVQTQYHNLPTYGETKNGIEKLNNDIFKDGFYVPENVVIIGTMNDIDRNVETFDFALRRRFDWIPIKANDFMETSLRSMLNDEKVSKDLAQRAIRMNEVISGESGKRFGLNEDYHIGPAYFKDYDKAKSMGKNLDDIWKRNIEPILKEYLRGKNGVDKFINDCHKALMNDQSGDKDTNEPQTTAEDEE
ncbi:AAA family ATPase [Ruminococcus bicirculans]|uniref:AAA family ATPase n=1 Tax=Ruminococcus bicirculans (ex Wegman et al. 2014) TaxID=1160721 RepID=A0AAW6ED79_9FIRM|nr:AAA family ATPase [Ruminococcus bicirculans (ex Wegman et al. 2014)]MDB8749718.1 AAA family ATPase [Ruminococcus bicirculans (ex Wegman et al. 2014)]